MSSHSGSKWLANQQGAAAGSNQTSGNNQQTAANNTTGISGVADLESAFATLGVPSRESPMRSNAASRPTSAVEQLRQSLNMPPATRAPNGIPTSTNQQMHRQQQQQYQQQPTMMPHAFHQPVRPAPHAPQTNTTTAATSSSAALAAAAAAAVERSSPDSFQRYSSTSSKQKLYEAYNDLHGLAQDFHKPFDAPAILVVGHQTDGKSALVEALMGFQFNHVGGGTKTRRPITLHMKYNAACVEPLCYLVTDEGFAATTAAVEEIPVTLEELQEYIESENRRLERESEKFWAKEIVVKIEYKYCPNLTIIDTPGLIAAAPGRKHSTQQSSARAVEQLVRSKMEQKEFIILCLEDNSDWGNTTTRRLVMSVDPELRRSVIVSTKLDTRVPQFSQREDVEFFLHPPPKILESTILGGAPFFTSVPSGRVGTNRDAAFPSNEAFRDSVRERETRDVTDLERLLDRPLDSSERARCGVSRLRKFLEELLQRRYLENVPSIVPLLEKEHRIASSKLEATVTELNRLDRDHLKEMGRHVREGFLDSLGQIMRGTVSIAVGRHGETLAEEHIRSGAYVGPDGKPLPHYAGLPNANMRLYGGAQYHRAIVEFRHVVGQMKCPPISREEIVNACGIDDVHDGVNYTRAACVIAIGKAKDVFEPFLFQLGYRLSHVMKRMLPIAISALQKKHEMSHGKGISASGVMGNPDAAMDGAQGTGAIFGVAGHSLFLRRVGDSFHRFIEMTEKDCRDKALEDLESTTRYISWSLHSKSGQGLRDMLRRADAARAASTAMEQHSNEERALTPSSGSSSDLVTSAPARFSEMDLYDMLSSTLWSRRLGSVTTDIVQALVCSVFDGIRDHVISCAELKFNCFFLMPIIDKFPGILREHLERAYEEDLDGVFDVASVRESLERSKMSLDAEVAQVERLQEKFQSIHHTLQNQQVESTTSGSDAGYDAWGDENSEAQPRRMTGGGRKPAGVGYGGPMPQLRASRESLRGSSYDGPLSRAPLGQMR